MNTAIITTINIKKMIQTRYDNANEAFHRLYWDISNDGEDFGDTKAFFNVGFYIDNPEQMEIKDSNALNVTGKKIMLLLNGRGIYLAIETYLN